MFPRRRTLFGPKPPEASYPVLPIVGDDGQTNVPGVYAAGEIAGTPLVRLGLNAGHTALDNVAASLPTPSTDPDLLDVVIVGSGSAGLAATVNAHDRGLQYVTIEAAAFANTFVTMTKGKVLFAEPQAIALKSRVWFEECTKEQLLERWRAFVEREGLRIREHEPASAIRKHDDHFEVVTPAGTYRCRRVLLCLGKAGNPRKLGVPGEHEFASRIAHRLLDPDTHADQDIVVIGAGDVACEAAIALAQGGSNRVTLSAIDKELTYPKQRNIDAVRRLADEGKLTLLLDSRVQRFESDVIAVDTADGPRHVPWDHAFEMIGAELPVGFLRNAGIQLNTDWPWRRFAGLAVVFACIYSLYAIKSYGKGITAFPFEHLIDASTYDQTLLGLFRLCFQPFAWLFEPGSLAEIYADRGFQQGYLYSLAYTLVMGVFGYEALVRWRGIATDKRYQTWRYASLLSFQVGFFLLVNVVGVHALSVKYAWRTWGLYQPFPLYFNTFFWWESTDPTWIIALFVGGGLLGTFVAIPVASRNHGKRFCTWICGCGGMAETLGDRWRHLSSKGTRSREWEFQGSVIAAAAFLIGFVIVGAHGTKGNNVWWHIYSYAVDFWLVAVIPMAVYPFFGGKVWCRYWCPLAAYNGWLSAWYGRLKIVANEKCITCTECSKYCQVGVDVMAYAKDQQPFDNSNTACIQCGICIDVCPMDVLAFETSDPSATTLIAEGRSSGLTPSPSA